MSENLMDMVKDDAPEEKTVDKPADKPEENPDSNPVERPENIPEKFWDKDKKTIRTDEIIKSYSELEKELTKVKTSAQVPETYEVSLPEEYKDSVQLGDDDPMLAAYKGYAKEKGFTQDQFNANIGFFVDFMTKQAQVDQQSEIDALGGKDKAIEKIKQVRTFLKARLSQESFDVLAATATTAAQINALDELRKLISVQNPPPEGGDSQLPVDLTEEDLRALMKKPEYYDESKRDPKIVKKVEEGFKKLYGKKQG